MTRSSTLPCACALSLAFAALALAQDAKTPTLPLEAKVGRVVEVEVEFRSVETATVKDVDEGVTYTSREVSTESDRAVYLDRIEALRPKGDGALRRTQYVLSASASTRMETHDEENGKALPADEPEETKTKSKLTSRHLLLEWKSPLESEINVLGEPKVGAAWDVDSSLFAFELESYFPKTLPKDGKASGKDFLGRKTSEAFPGWPQELGMNAVAQVIGMAAAYGKQALKSVSWTVKQSPAAKGKGPSITYSVHVEIKASEGKGVSEALSVDLSARIELRAPSKTFPAPPK